MYFRLTELNQPIPEGVTYLDLGNNRLGLKTGAELVAIMRAIPQSVTSLDLRENGLRFKTGAELVAITQAIPQSVTSLDLRGNDLGLKTGAVLVAIMQAIPPSVTSLDLRGNYLRLKTLDKLEQISKHLPYVTKISCSELSQKKFTALNRYNGHGIKKIYHVMNERLPSDYSLEVLSFLLPGTKKEIKKVLTKELPPPILPSQEVPRLNRFSVGSIGSFIALGLIARICFYLLFEQKNNQTYLNPAL